MIATKSPLGQIGETLRQLHQWLVDTTGSEQAAQAIEGVSVVFVVVLVLVYLKGRYSGPARRRRSAKKRFQQLSRINRLTAGDRQLLLAMARHLELEEPGLLFVRRSLFETAAEQGGFKPERVDVLRREIYS